MRGMTGDQGVDQDLSDWRGLGVLLACEPRTGEFSRGKAIGILHPEPGKRLRLHSNFTGGGGSLAAAPTPNAARASHVHLAQHIAIKIHHHRLHQPIQLQIRKEHTGVDLHDLVEQARVIRNVLSGIHSRYNRKVVEQAAILGVLNAEIFGDTGKASAAAPYIAKRLDAFEGETDRGWEGKFVEGEGFAFERTVRGVKEVAIIDHALLGSADARRLDEYAATLQDAYAKPGSLRRKGEDIPITIHGPVSLFEAITGSGRKGLTLQRYKGLGEMNPGSSGRPRSTSTRVRCSR